MDDKEFENLTNIIFGQVKQITELPQNQKNVKFNKLLGYYNNLSIFQRRLKVQNMSDIQNYFTIINKYFIHLKKKCSDLIIELSDIIYNSSSLLESYLNIFDHLDPIVQCISIIFSDLIQEVTLDDKYYDVDNTYLEINKKKIVSDYFYSYWYNLVYCRLGYKLTYLINEKINSLRHFLNTEFNIDKLIDLLEKDELLNIEASDLLDYETNKIINQIEKFILTTDTLDDMIENNESTQSFKQNYNSLCKNLYNYFNNKIKHFKNIEDKIDETCKMILIESFVNNRFVYHSQSLGKSLIDTLLNDINCIKTYIDEKFEKITNEKQLIDKILCSDICFDNNYTSDQLLVKILDNLNIKIILNKLLEFRPLDYKSLVETILNYIGKILLNILEDSDIKLALDIYFITHFIFQVILEKNLDNIKFDTLPIMIELKHLFVKKLNNDIFKAISLICSDQLAKGISFGFILNSINSLFGLFCDLDNQELEFKKQICKMLLFNNKDTLNFARLNSLALNINNFNLKAPIKIFKSIQESDNISQEFNFTHSMDAEFAEVRVFPDGITPLKIDKPENYKSETFENYKKSLESSYKEYYISFANLKNRQLKYLDNLSRMTLSLEFGSYSICLICRYSQADIIFYLQNEYDNIRENYNSLDDSSKKTLLFETESIKKLKFVSVLIKKKIIIFDINGLLYVNNKIILKKNKEYDFTKIKNETIEFTNLDQKQAEEERLQLIRCTPKNNMIFEQKDYTMCFVVRYCKLNKTRFINSQEIYNYVYEKIKQRFILKKERFAELLDKMVDDDYLEQHISSNLYKYII